MFPGLPTTSPHSFASTDLLLLCLLLLAVSCGGRLHNFASLDVLSDGEVERFIHYGGLTVKETQVNSSDNRESLLLRQMTDGTTFIQLIYTTNNTIRDCEHLKSKKLIRQFLRSFRNSIHARRNSSPIISLDDSQPLPPYYAPWFSMHKLKHRCNKLHKTIKKMTKRVPNIYDNLIDMPEIHYDWKFVNRKHKQMFEYMRHNTTVPKYLVEQPSVTRTDEVVKSVAHTKSLTKVLDNTGAASKTTKLPTVDGNKRKVIHQVNTSTEPSVTSSHKPNTDSIKSYNKHSNKTHKCRRRKLHKCSKNIINPKDSMNTNSSHKNLTKSQNNLKVTNVKAISKIPHNVYSTATNHSVTAKVKAVVTVINKTNSNDNRHIKNISMNPTIKSKGQKTFINVNKPNNHTHQTKIPQTTLVNRTFTSATAVTTERAKSKTIPTNNVTTSIENVRIRHHHKQNRHFKKKKRKKNGKKKLKQQTINTVNISNINNELNKPSSQSNVRSIGSPTVHNDSQLEISTPVTNAMHTTDQSETVTSNTIGLSNIVDNNLTNDTKTDSFNDLTEESSQHHEQVNVINVKHGDEIIDVKYDRDNEIDVKHNVLDNEIDVDRNEAGLNRTRNHQETMHVYRNLTAEENMSALERLKLGVSNLMLVPGTKWCGYGNGATDFTDLGSFSGTDVCCRRHDSCRLTIPGFGRKWGHFNFKPFTLSYCGCDQRFRTCLKLEDSGAANLVGKLFFNVLQTKCFVLRPQKSCKQRSWWGKCTAYEASGHRAEIRDNHPY